MLGSIEEIGQGALFFLFFSMFVIIGIMGGLLVFGWWVSQKRGSLSPFSRRPMMLGVDLPFSIKRQIEEFVKSLPQPENKPFDMTKAAICRETGRIIRDCVVRGEIVRLGSRFLRDRYPGNWVSWGSLSEEKRGLIKLHHREIFGYQMEHSTKNRDPEQMEQYYAVMKPGPLYVDVTTNILLGWQIVPGTNFEVLVIKNPDFESIDEIL